MDSVDLFFLAWMATSSWNIQIERCLMKIIMNKKPGRVLLICIIILAIICPLHIYHDKKKVEDIKSGAIVIENSETPIDELHPEFAYLWLFPYGIVEVVLLSLYYVRTRD